VNAQSKSFSRRGALRLAGIAGLTATAAAALAACGGESAPATAPNTSGPKTPAKELRALCWEGYTDASFAKGFTEQYGTEIKSTFIGSNDELVAQLTGGAGQFDIISPSVDTTQSLIEAGLVQPLETAWIPNLHNTYDMFRTNKAVQGQGGTYGVPMCWGFVPVIYDRRKVNGTVDSWSVLWDKQHARQITVWDDITTVYNAALLLGITDVYKMSKDQLGQVREKLMEQKPLLTKYWATAGELTNLFRSGEVVVGDSFGGFTLPQLRANGMDAVEVIPKEGATAWVDFWMVPAQSNNLYTAALWMDYIQRPEVQAQVNKFTGYAPTNVKTAGLVSPDVVKQYSLDDAKNFDRLLFWQKVENRQAYLDLLVGVKAS